MLDPIPAPRPALFEATKQISDQLQLQTLPYHIHEVLFAAVMYQTIQTFLSPAFSSFFFPSIYPRLNRRTRVNWDVHVVSLVQSCLINTLALWVLFTDEERGEMNSLERIYGYTGGCGMIQGLAAGYFVWDLVVCTRHYNIFGLGILAHAVSALIVFSFGFRPYANYYAPCFILYELSSPFLNIHWFCDKLNLTGSKIQWYNGIILLVTFFGCRLVWGTYQSLRVYQDTMAALYLNTTIAGHLDASNIVNNVTSTATNIFAQRDGQLCLGDIKCIKAQMEVMKFAGPGTEAMPVWLAVTYLITNVLLNGLNFYWFAKMVETVRKRFQGAPHDEFKSERAQERRSSAIEEAVDGLEKDVLSGTSNGEVEVVKPEAGTTGFNSTVIDGASKINKRRADMGK